MTYYLHRTRKCLIAEEELAHFGIDHDDPMLYRVTNCKEGYEPTEEYMAIVDTPEWDDTTKTVTIRAEYTPVTDDDRKRAYQKYMQNIAEVINKTLTDPVPLNFGTANDPIIPLKYDAQDLLLLMNLPDMRELTLVVEDRDRVIRTQTFPAKEFTRLRCCIAEAIYTRRYKEALKVHDVLTNVTTQDAAKYLRMMETMRATGAEDIINTAAQKR